jgi:hypothetical protein
MPSKTEAAREASQMKSVGEMVREEGIQVYDTAMPINFVYGVIDRFGYNPSGHIVWCYDGAMFGEPVGLTKEGKATVAAIEEEGAAFWQSLKGAR